MKEVYEFLKNSHVFFIATIDNNKPRVRPFGAVNIFEDKLYFQTGKVKDVYKQIEASPNVEISSFIDGRWIRLEGQLVVDDRIEAKKSMLDNNPELKSMYSADDPNTIVFYIKNAKASICSFTDKPIYIEF